MMHTTHDALIVGCGIAGPVAALALQRAGLEAAIYEAYDRPADQIGSFLNLASNGVDALATLDLARPILEVAFPTPRMVMWSGSGTCLGEVVNGLRAGEGYGSQTIQRGQLHRVLREAAQQREVPIVGGKRLIAAETDAAGVTARFEDGSSARARMLIGADGIQSRVRRIIDPQAPTPRDKKFFSLGGRAFVPTVEPTPDAFHMIFGKRAFFGFTVRPTGEVYWFANVSASDAVEPAGASAETIERWKVRLRQLLADDAGPAVEIVTATANELAAYPVCDLRTVPTWHRDGMVLVGDAAHATSPSSGQGASLAIEDAIVLARCLRDEARAADAFVAYERLRRPRVERVAAQAARVDHGKMPGAVGRWVRDLMMPAMLRVFAKPEAQAWLYRYHIDWNLEHI